MTGRLNGKIAIVTGGLSGIGLAIAHRLAQDGACVVAADISAETAPLSREKLASAWLDVSDPDSVAGLMHDVACVHGRLDLLVNSAGIGSDRPFLDTPIDLFDRILSVNLRGTFLVGQEAARLMVKAGGGAIVNIASVSGLRGNVGRSAYGASKAGVVVLSQVMAVDLAQYGIRVNVVAPGPIDTPLVSRMHDDAIRNAWTHATPMGRYGSPEEVAGAAAFLCSDDASFITGHVLAVDGGLVATSLARR
jgi:NAD(P)-dependent dehydrogenase (short-subunit alcohol dehydrogenase family)